MVVILKQLSWKSLIHGFQIQNQSQKLLVTRIKKEAYYVVYPSMDLLLIQDLVVSVLYQQFLQIIMIVTGRSHQNFYLNLEIR